jgi:hypothetical protein
LGLRLFLVGKALITITITTSPGDPMPCKRKVSGWRRHLSVRQCLWNDALNLRVRCTRVHYRKDCRDRPAASKAPHPIIQGRSGRGVPTARGVDCRSRSGAGAQRQPAAHMGTAGRTEERADRDTRHGSQRRNREWREFFASDAALKSDRGRNPHRSAAKRATCERAVASIRGA